MSLDAIRELRLSGQKPAGVVTVLMGRRPRWLRDDATLVVVRPADDPRFMDWRPMLGLTTVIVAAEQQPDRMLAVLNALEKLQVKFFGVADPTGTYPMLVGADEQHHWLLRTHREALCL